MSQAVEFCDCYIFSILDNSAQNYQNCSSVVMDDENLVVHRSRDIQSVIEYAKYGL